MTSPEKNPSDPLSGTGTTQMQGTSQTQGAPRLRRERRTPERTRPKESG